MQKQLPEMYISQQRIAERVASLGIQISEEYKGQELTVVCVLKGSMHFCADLMRFLDLDVKLEFITVSSYGGERTTSSGQIELIYDGTTPMSGKNILLVEDIIDTGLTISWLLARFQSYQPRSIKVATLLTKRSCLKYDIAIDYSAFDIENKFVVGYGLDYNEFYRNLPYIGVF